MAMHNAVLLQEENSRLRAENARQKRKRQQRRAFIQTGGSLTIGEGVSSTTAAHQKAAKAAKAPKAQKARVEARGGEETTAEQIAPTVQKRAPRRCSACNSTEHTARTCPCR